MADDPGSVPGQLLDGVAAEEGMVFEAPVVEARVEWSGGCFNGMQGRAEE